MQQRLRWTLRNEDNGQTLILTRDPKGWDEIQLTHNRSEEYHGVFFDFSLEVAFSCKGGGKEFIDAIYDTKGGEGNVSILVEYKCSQHNWCKIFNGKLNYSTYKQEYRGKVLYTSLDIIKKGITQTIKNREGVDVDLCATESIGGVALNSYNYSCYEFNLHSKVIFLETQWRIENTEFSSFDYLQDDFDSIAGTTRTLFHTHALQIESQDLEESSDGVHYWNKDHATTSTVLAGSGISSIHDAGLATPIITPSVYNWSFSESGTFYWNMGVGGGYSLTVTFNIVMGNTLSNITTIYTETIYSDATTNSSFTHDYNISSSGTVTMEDGDKIWAYWTIIYIHSIGSDAALSMGFEVTSADFVINTESITDDTTGKVVMIHEAWSRICECITDQTLAFKSEFFGRTNSQGLAYATNGYGSFTAITDGLRIRGFTQSLTEAIEDGFVKKGILTNLKDMFMSCNSIWGIGLGIEDLNGTEVARVEEVDYFYNNTNILRLSDIPNIQMTFTGGFSGIEIGYSKWKVEEKGGLDECNSLARWVFTKIRSKDELLSFISKYIGGMYAIETTRRQNIAFRLTQDTKYDDEIFVIATNRDVSNLDTAEKNENFTSVTNLLSPSTAYNLRFNLFSNFDRLMNQFTGSLTKDQPHPINYSYLEGNGNMTFQINENHAGDLNNNVVQNVQNTAYQNSLHRRPNPILLPELYTFSYPLKFDEYLNILANPYGYIEFSEGTSNYKKGYIKTLNFNLKRKMADFTLIRKFE